MGPDIAESGRSKEGIDDRVGQHIGVGMAGRTARLVGEVNPPEDAGPSSNQGMTIPALAHADHGDGPAELPANRGCA